MKKKKSTLLLATAASIIGITVFGTVLGLATKVKYRGVNPTQGVISQLGLIDSVAFKPTVAHFTSDYQTVKKALLNGKTFSATSSDFADFVNKFDFLTNNGRTVLNIPKKYQVVIKDFSAEDDKQRFRLSFYLKETLPDGNVAQSASKFIYLSPIDAPKAALAQFNQIIETNFASLIQNPLSHFSSDSAKPLALTRSSDFAKKLNEFNDETSLTSYLQKFFDIETLKANIRLQSTDFSFAKGDLENPFVFSFVKNPQNSKEFATDLNQDLKTVRLYVKAEFSPEAKVALGNYKNKDDSYTTALDLKTSDNKTLFADNEDLKSQLDVSLLDASDYYAPDVKIEDLDKEQKRIAESFLTLKQRDSFRSSSSANSSIPKFSLYTYDALSFYKQMQELVAKPQAIKDIIDAGLVRGLTFSFGKYDLLFDDLKRHLDYQFLVSDAKIKQNSVSKKLFIEIPIKITLKSSIFGDTNNDVKPILEKTVTFKLDNFRNVAIEKAFETLYPGVKEELDKAAEDQKKAKAAENGRASQLSSTKTNEDDDDDEDDEENPKDSPIQYPNKINVEDLSVGSSALKPFSINNSSYQEYALSSYEIGELIKQKNYAKLVELISNPLTYNVNLRLKEKLFSENVKVPNSEEIQKANFDIDSSDATLFSRVYSASSSVFENKSSLYAYYRHILSLKPKDAIFELVKLGKKIGWEFEGFNDLPLDFNAEDLKSVKIKTKFDGRKSADQNTEFKLSLLDFNNYYLGSPKSASAGLPLFLPAKLESIDSSSSSDTSKNWREQIIEEFKNQNQQDQLGQLPNRIWQKIIGNEKAEADKDKIVNKILEKFKKGLEESKKPSFWDDGTTKPFKDEDFAPIQTLQDLVFAFYSSAALSDNWNNFQQSGAKPTIVFEEQKEKENQDPSVYELKFHYAIGFQDNAGKFNQDVIKSSTRTIYLKTSGRSKTEVKAIQQLNETIENAPLGLQNIYLDPEKFGIFRTLASSLVKTTQEDSAQSGIDNSVKTKFVWISDELKKPQRPEIKEEKPRDWFEGKLKQNQSSSNNDSENSSKSNSDQSKTNQQEPAAKPVNVSTFADYQSSPFFVTDFQDGSNSAGLDSSSSDQKAANKKEGQKELDILREKLEILLGQEFIRYYQQDDNEVSFEITNIEKVNETTFKVTFKLVKILKENTTISKVLSDQSISLLVNTSLEKAPELAKDAEVFDTKWASVYDPESPLAASTQFKLTFKDKIPTDAKGNISEQWLSTVPVIVHPQMLAIKPVVIAKVEKLLKINDAAANNIKKGKKRYANSKDIEASDGEKQAFLDAKTYILNPQTQRVALTLNELINQQSDISNKSQIKVKDIKLESENTLTFNLQTKNIKRLMNSPITFSYTNPVQMPLLNNSEYEKFIITSYNKDISIPNFNQHLVIQNQNDNSPSSKAVFIKPKYLIEKTVGIPWMTGFDKYGGDSGQIIQGKKTEITVKRKKVQYGDDWLEKLGFQNTEYATKIGLSFRVFDPDAQLAELQRGSISDEVELFQQNLYELDEENIYKRGWINVHPSQNAIHNDSEKLPENYLNVVLNRPWKVTLYNSSDFITNLFSNPDNKTKFKKVIARKVNNNYVDWGSAYFTLWYPQQLIQEQSNIISANIGQILFKSHDELKNNTKLIAPNIVQWWPNIQKSEAAKIWTEEGKDAANFKNKRHNNKNLSIWSSVKVGGFTLQALKTRFKRKSRSFVLTTNIPVPLQEYKVDLTKEDWRLVFQNDDHQIAMIRATAEKNSEDDKKWIQFEAKIPDEMFTSNVRFVGVMKRTDQKTEWLPIINTSVIWDYRGKTDPTSINEIFNKNYTVVKTLALTNNAFNNVFKEFNITKKKIQ